MHLIEVVRDTYTAQTTLGKLYITPLDGEREFFCHTLEDTVRPVGIKCKGHTAIPSGVEMAIGMRYSPSFRRKCLVLSTQVEGDTYAIDAAGVRFTQVMFHGGNDHGDTEGCPLVAFNRIDNDTIQGTAEKALFEKVQGLMNTCDVKAVFTNII